jgi:hypothetical protein
MKYTLICTIVTASCVFAQTEIKQVVTMSSVAGGFANTSPLPRQFADAPVQAAPYSATVVNESIQTLADGNRIVQHTTGSTARDSQGRTRQDMAPPPIGNMSAADAPHIVFIQDPVAQTAYTLNLTDKTAHKMPTPPAGPPPPAGLAAGAKIKMLGVGPIPAGPLAAGPVAVGALAMPGLQTGSFIYRATVGKDQGEAKTEDLGSQTMEGVMAQGARTTRTIPAGEIGNDKPIEMVTEVWTSPELKTIVYSKRSDPRMGDQTFRLTNIVRAEPDASLFAIPPDFKLVDGSEPGKDVFFYRQTP